MSSKPSIPKGTRDFLPSQVIKRKYIFNTIENVFKTYGYLPIETPAVENLSTLSGKYGEEGDKLLFKIRSNKNLYSELESKMSSESFSELINNYNYTFIPKGSEKGLRYDLTVPFARFVVMHQNEINFPFKRYQIQQVWRGEAPGRGRYQEFYQCDVDVVGSESLMYEAELVKIYANVFKKLGIKIKILINNRKILFGLAELMGITDKFMDMTIAIDKLDKIGADAVAAEMNNKGIDIYAANKIVEIIKTGNLYDLKRAFSELDEGTKGIEEIQTVLDYLDGSVPELTFDISLARGLNYYTGCIFEVKVDTSSSGHPGFSMGSIGGGGRYDNLTGVFGLNGVSGVGVSFGAERIYDVMEELNLFPEDVQKDIEVLFVALDEESHRYAFKQVAILRQAGIPCDLYPEPTKMKKQMSYANARKVPYVAIIGETEREAGKVSLKNMVTGEQSDVEVLSLSSYFVSQ